MGTMHHLQDDTDSETTTEMRARRQRVLDQERVEQLLAKRRSVCPVRRYTQVTIAVAICAALDWVAVAAHIAVARGTPLTPVLAAHELSAATLSAIAVFLGVGWAVLNNQCRLHAQRDEIDKVRHRELMERIDHAVQAGVQREWMGYVHGIRDGAFRGSGGQAGGPSEDGNVVAGPWRHGPARPNLG